MTLRRSLAYYIAAVLVGGCLMGVAMWLPGGSRGTDFTPNTRGASGFLFVCLVGIVLGTPTALLFGFLLRHLSGLLRPGSAFRWVLAGAVLAPTEIWLLARLADLLRHALRDAGPADFLLAGPAIVKFEGRLWAAAPVGALTALVLCRIRRASEPKPELHS